MTALRVIARGLCLPAELYLQPERFARGIDALAPDGDILTAGEALRIARQERAARLALAERLGTAAVALSWPVLLSAILSLTGASIDWAGVAFGIAVGTAFGVAFGIVFGIGGGVAFGVAVGTAFGVAFGVAFGIGGGDELGGGVAFGVVAGIVAGVECGVATGVAFGVVAGVAVGVGGGIALGVVAGVTFIMAGLRLVLAPLEVAAAWWLDWQSRSGVDATLIWARHPARWDLHGSFRLPGLTRLLARLQLEHPTLAIEAARIVGANPSRRSHVVGAALLIADHTVRRIASMAELRALGADLEAVVAAELLPKGERAELDLLAAVSHEAASALAAESVANRVERLRAARRLLARPNPTSDLIAVHRPALTGLVERAMRKAERERREREPVPRVYRPSGTPLDTATEDAPSTFKGRRAVFERLEDLLGAAQRSTVLLHGPRRSGKTSLLKQLPVRLGSSAVPVFVDLQGDLGAAESSATLLHGLASAILDQVGERRKIYELPALRLDALHGEPFVTFARWLDALERAVGDHHVLVCLDEYEQLQEQIAAGRLDGRVLDLLRSIVQHRRRVTMLLTGVRTLDELPPAWASTLISTTSIELGPLQRMDAAQLIEEPVPDFPRVYSPQAIEAILAETACQPFLLQVLCSVLIDMLNDRRWHDGEPQLTADDVTAAREHAIQRAENYFLDTWHDVPARARPLVRQLARPHVAADANFDHADEGLVEAVLHLERRHIIGRTANGYTLTAPLFAQYVNSKQSVAG